MTRQFATLLSLIAALFAVPHVAHADGGPDTFGYSCTSSTDLYQWIEPTTTSPVAGIAIIDVPSPITLYGTSFSRVFLQKAGFLSQGFAASPDVTPDCPLPAVASEGRGNRIYVNHANLVDPIGSEMLYGYEYFVVSPHPHHNGGVHVFTWLNCVRSGHPTDTPFAFQVLVFDNTDILMQFPPGNHSINEATHGIQNDAASAGLAGAAGISYGCNDPNAFSGAARGVLFSMPTRTVNTSDDIVSPIDGQRSLREAVAQLPNGGKIDFASNLSGSTFTLLSDLITDEPISIDASTLAAGITITDNGNAGQRIQSNSLLHTLDVDFTDMRTAITAAGPLIISRAQIRDNATSVAIGSTHSVCITRSTFTNNSAGGISCIDLTNDNARRIHIEDSTFTSNDSGEHGGALSVSSGGTGTDGYQINIIDSNFVNNDSDGSGGAIAVMNSESLQISHCEFRSNLARGMDLGDYAATERGGGAIFTDGVSTAIASSRFLLNETSDSGAGALHSLAGSITVETSTFDQNVHGAIETRNSGFSRIESCTIAGNTAGYAIVAKENTELTLTHCTIAQNSGPSVGSAVLVGTGSEVTFGHNIFADNAGFSGRPFVLSAPDAVATSIGFNLADTDEPRFDLNLEDAPSKEPMLEPLDDYGGPHPTMALQEESPAINSGDLNVSDPPETDGRGAPRISPSNPAPQIDRGAFEYQNQIQVTTAADENITPGTGVSFREALSWIGNGGTILFDPALDGETIGIGFPALNQAPSKLTIDASNLPAKITLEETIGVMPDLLRSQPGGNLLVNHVIFSNAYPVANGASEYSDCEFHGNVFGLIAKGDLELNDCLVKQLVVIDTGGGPASATITDCDFLDIEGEGAIFIDADPASLDIERTVIDGTSITGTGSPVVSVRGNVTLTDSTISNSDSGDLGGALHITDGELLAINSTLSGNFAKQGGGAIYAENSSVRLEHCTVVQNSTTSGAAGIQLAGGSSTGTFGHSIFAHNINRFGPTHFDGSLVSSLGYNLFDTTGEITAKQGDLTGVQPLLAPLSHYGSNSGRRIPVHAPLAISPVIDAGNQLLTSQPKNDQRGFARIADGHADGTAILDIGAVEAALPVFVQHQGPSSLQGSLGAALASVSPGGRVLFDSDLDGLTIFPGAILKPVNSVQIDATPLLRGITVDAADSHACLEVASGDQVSLHAVTLRNGRITSSSDSGAGARALDGSSLTFTHGTIHDCEAAGLSSGGALAGDPGSFLHVFNSTLSHNSAAAGGSAIFLQGDTTKLQLIHSAVLHNTATAGPLPVAGIDLTSANCLAYSSLIASNTDGSGSLRNFGADNNLANFASQFTSAGFLITDTVLVAPWGNAFSLNDTSGVASADIANPDLTDERGWSKVHLTEFTSTATDNGGGEARYLPTFDQRGFARVADGDGDGTARLNTGPYELKAEFYDSDGDQMPDWWEHRYWFNPDDPSDADDNPDGDAYDNLEEFQNNTHPRLSDVISAVPVFLGITHDADSGTTFLNFTGPPGEPYQLQDSSDLKDWSDFRDGTFNGSVQGYRFSATDPRHFYRFKEP